MTEITIHQALLGYDRGHRILASSRLIESHSRHALLQFSDRSISARRISKSGYLTGYPLPDEGLYVLARTWNAPEVSRPGCVWTHSLLISFTELAQIDDPRKLMDCFLRPSQVGDSEKYSKPIVVDMDQEQASPSVEEDLARELIERLYTLPYQKVLLKVSQQEDVDTTLLAVWGQQWPRLRRNFRFCSLTDEDRSTADHDFDVQFLPSARKGARVGWDEEGVEREVWVNLCLADLLDLNPDFRKFIWRAGGDISNGRARFAELCKLFSERVQSNKVTAVERTLGYVLHRLPGEEGKLLRSSAIEDAVNAADRLGPEWLMEILPYLDNYAENMDKGPGRRLVRRYWDIDPEVVVGPRGTAMSPVRE